MVPLYTLQLMVVALPIPHTNVPPTTHPTICDVLYIFLEQNQLSITIQNQYLFFLLKIIKMVKPHVMLTTFPAQGHINPALQFAKNLVKMGIQVTFSTSIYAQRLMDDKKSIDNIPKGLMNFVPFSDGFDDGFDHSKDPVFYMSQLRKCGSETVKNIIMNCSENGCSITCLLYSIFLPWAAEV